MLPQMLLEMVDFLRTQNFTPSIQSRDGRKNSASDEEQILRLLESKFPINCANVRDWVDFSFSENGQFYPVNIKVSTMKTADNLNCKLGIYYALTGKEPTFGNGINWKEYLTILRHDLKENDRDYYFLIISKNDTKDIFGTSLKCLESIVSNGDNLPFQANWDKNRQITPRDFKEAEEFLLSKLGESLKKRAERYFQFEQYFPNILSNNNRFDFNRFDFYIECDHCRQRNYCYISHTINGNIITHCRCNKE
ncbi:restriction endonuclease [Helicobacter trogontum]|uniref:restriction endonuclease n=1 Tax=Helicobacter trogontum TaxID=50960 RepID=UPI00311A1179